MTLRALLRQGYADEKQGVGSKKQACSRSTSTLTPKHSPSRLQAHERPPLRLALQNSVYRLVQLVQGDFIGDGL